MSFEKIGISQNHPLIKKLWKLSTILHTTPWDDKLLGLNLAQVDLMIKLYVEDHPELKLIPTQDIKDEKLPPQKWNAWNDVIRGPSQSLLIFRPGDFFKKYYNLNFEDYFSASSTTKESDS